MSNIHTQPAFSEEDNIRWFVENTLIGLINDLRAQHPTLSDRGIRNLIVVYAEPCSINARVPGQ
jgi:hypothetical protein